MTGSYYPNWTPVGANIQCTGVTSIHALDALLVVAVCGHFSNYYVNGNLAGVFKSGDGGQTWSMTSFPPNYDLKDVLYISPTELLVASKRFYKYSSASSFYFMFPYGGVSRSADGGKTWSWVIGSGDEDSLIREARGLETPYPGSRTVFSACLTLNQTFVVHASEDGGVKWRDVTGLY
jgi:hypothetical protein